MCALPKPAVFSSPAGMNHIRCCTSLLVYAHNSKCADTHTMPPIQYFHVWLYVHSHLKHLPQTLKDLPAYLEDLRVWLTACHLHDISQVQGANS
jgi:hypothetical protein